MKKSLVIVESPAKAKTLNKYLGKDFNVVASVGHVMDLPKSKLGVDIKGGFVPAYETIKGKAKVIAEIKKAGKEAEAVYLASDPDREGEAIAYHIYEVLGGEKAKKKIYRVLFNEITEKAVKEAIAHPSAIDKNKVDAQQARRVLDRLVGYQVSPLLWKKVRYGLSAGRVQSVAVRLICDREREIRKFVPREYWSIIAEFEGFGARLVKRDGEKLEISGESSATAILIELKGKKFSVSEVEKKERKRNPLPPFITSRLQQDGVNKLSFSAKKTMMLAQQLYEGVELGDEGPTGLITYMRTDSVRVSTEAQASARAFIASTYGKAYVPDKPNVFKSKKSAQEAHEAIRPASMDNPPERVKPHLTKDQWRLYELIWKRFLASQMTPAVLDQTSVGIEAGRYLFQANGAVVKFPGFTVLYEEEEEEKVEKLPQLKKGDSLKPGAVTPNQHFTQPPPRYTEATLVKELEENGIGRPSTYASIISTIQEREYVSKEKARLGPTELGFLVTDMLVESFPKILDAQFTARMEEELDEVEDGSMDWRKVMEEFYCPFSQSLEKAQGGMRDIKKEEVPTDLVCPKCGKPMIIKWGRKGNFLACTGYPDCKTTSDFITDESGKVKPVERVAETTGDMCQACGKPMLVKSGRFGKFLACSDYPKCKTTKPYPTDIVCSKCGKPMIIRLGKKGKFLACSGYPDCKNTSNFTIDESGKVKPVEKI